MALRWGIASAGKISHDFVTALGTLPSSEHRVQAVAAQELGRAQAFAALHSIPQALLGYEALAKNPDIDIVYIGNLITQHHDVSKMMLEHGKHVLCEKPLCINRKQVQSLVDLARRKNLFLMEAVWARFFPAYVEVRNLVRSGALGKIEQVNVQFGVLISEVERIKTKKLGGGTVLDLGIYVLQFSQMIFGCEPTKVVASGHLNQDGVDTSMSCVLTYPDGGTASLSTHSKVRLSNEAVVVGSKGTVKLPWFWCPDKLQMADGSWKEWPLPPAAHPFNFDNSCGLRYEAEECRRCIKEGLTQSPVMTWDDSLMIAKLEDNIRAQIGVKFEEDD